MTWNKWERHGSLPDVFERYVEGEGGTFYRQKVQDCQPLMDAVQKERNETGGWSENRTARKVGSVPTTIAYDHISQWDREGRLPKVGDPAYGHVLNNLLKDLLRDRDYSRFRTAESI